MSSNLRRLSALVALAAVALGGWSCLSRETPSAPVGPGEPKLQAEETTAGPPLLADQTAGSGINFTYHNGQEAGHYGILESLGGGVALIDYDGDGLLDVFIPGGGYYDGPKKRQIKGYPSRLYKNLGNWKFKDVTQEVGLDQPLFYTHGAAVADYDRDGWPDLLVTGWGRVALYHNEPDGKGGRRFVDVTAKSGLATDHLWSTSAAFADLDGDGYPDLYVCHYVDWSLDNNPRCSYHDASLRDVCPPRTFKALPHAVFHNNGNGTFTDVSEQAGLFAGSARENSKGLGVIIADLDGDGRPDVYVANDTMDNLLYMNRSVRGRIRFEEMGLRCGVARDDKGVPNGSMGVAVADVDGRGRPWVWVVNYQNENHALYRNDGHGLFTYATQPLGVAAIGQLYVGFGTGFIDLDLRGWEDIFIANGHVIRHPQGTDVAQQPVILRNQDGRKFVPWTQRGGPYCQAAHIGRGAAFGDLDNDGRCDIVISHVNEPVAVLRGEGGRGNHWLGVGLVGKGHADTVGAKITLEVGGRTLTRFVTGGGSYLSSGDPRRVFGLGLADKVGKLTVTWPSGEPRTQTWEALPIDRYHRLLQGEAVPQGPGGK